LREQLDPDRSVFDSVADGADFVETVNGQQHVHGYLEKFLFPPDRARTPVRALSGGERNRLLLARLFTRTFNLLVLDEPTNDLDIETLDLLEALLLEFAGTLLVVSHDRAFLDNVVTSTLVFEGGGRVGEYVGGYSDWVRQRKDLAAAPVATPAVSKRNADPPAAKRDASRAKPRKLSFRESTELAALPDRIDALEQERTRLHVSLADPVLLRDATALAAARTRLTQVEQESAAAIVRWEELETIAAEG
jgi:ATP-binding cassette subfamily F protein uup